MGKERIYLSSPTMHGDEQRFVNEAFETNWIAPLGPNVNAFEKEMAEYTGCGYAAALSAGTAAIHLALRLIGIQPGDVVFSSDLTFSATCNPICYEKAVPVFIDAEEQTWNMDPDALEAAFEKYPNAKAVICAHLYGTPAQIGRIREICDRRGVPLIEDAAESLGSTFQGKMTGCFGDIGIYSFNGNKIITTSGGGMLVSANEEYVDQARFLSTQARDAARYYQHSQLGFNYRMSNITAGVGRGQLLHIEEHKQKKQEIYRQYKEAFADIPAITMNPLNPEGDANNWLSCITIDPVCGVTPDRVMDVLADENIETRPIWKPMHMQPIFADADFFTKDGCAKGADGRSVQSLDLTAAPESVGAKIFYHGLCLPSDIKNTPEDMERIIGLVRGLFA